MRFFTIHGSVWDIDDPSSIAMGSIQLTQMILLDVASYMIADWQTPDEEAKRAAIDRVMEKLNSMSDAQNRILELRKEARERSE